MKLPQSEVPLLVTLNENKTYQIFFFWLRNSSVIALFSLKILSGNRYSEDTFICTCLIAYNHTNLMFLQVT